MTDFQILHGDALAVLKTLPAESVQCCITSPPYYGLRSYQTPPQVWGNHNECDHVFGEALKYIKQDTRSAEKKREQGAAVVGSITFCDITTNGNSGAFCINCNAWRGELGLEPTFQLYLAHLIEIFAEVKRVLTKDGTVWVNLGDSYVSTGGRNDHSAPSMIGNHSNTNLIQPARKNTTGIPTKSLMNIPARFAIAMTDELQMIQRNEIIWYKRACMPSSAKDRFTVDFEKIFMFSKSPKYKFNQQLEDFAPVTLERVNQPIYANQAGSIGNGGAKTNGPMKAVIGEAEGRNKRCVWDVPFEPSGDEHYAAYPTKLIEPMILAGSDEGDTVLDIFNGTGTTGLTALRNRRRYIGIELQEKYIGITNKRLSEVQVKLFV